MMIRFVDGPMPTSPTLVEHARAKLSRALRRFGGRVDEVAVHISDEDGPRHGPACRCRIHAMVAHGGVVAVAATSPDFFSAVSVAAGKLAAALGHKVGRRVDRRRP